MSNEHRTIGACIKIAIIDSNARDHLANERTLMAHTRTAFACIGLGVAVASTFLPNDSKAAAGLGLTLVLLGSLIFLYATPRYYANMYGVSNSVFALDYVTPAVFSTVLLATAVAAVVVIFR